MLRIEANLATEAFSSACWKDYDRIEYLTGNNEVV